MIDAMPRKLPPFVCRERNRHGTMVYYFRLGKGPRTRLPTLGAEGFDAAYQAALRGTPIEPKRVKVSAGTVAWLIDRYKNSVNYSQLSYATRRQRDNIFKNIVSEHGHESYADVTHGGLVKAVDRRKDTPAQARNFLDALRGLFRWAKTSEFVTVDPTEGIENPKRPKGPGFEVWTDADIAAYEARWAAGTKERVWLHVLLYTGLRRGDAVKIGKQHVRDGVATIRTEKNGMEVTIPLQPELVETLAIGPTSDLAWVCGKRSQPLTKETFGNYFKAACKQAGILGKSAHGVRKASATTAAEAGASVAELESLFGWEGGAMASHYTKTANRRRLAMQGAEKIRNANARTRMAGAGTEAESLEKSTAIK